MSQIPEDLVTTQIISGMGVNIQFIPEGRAVVLLKNGRFERLLPPGRQGLFRWPLQMHEVRVVDTTVRNLTVKAQNEFITRDQRRVDVSLNLQYHVTDPVKVAIELKQPITSLVQSVKNLLGQAIGSYELHGLIQQGRQIIQDWIMQRSPQVEQQLGIQITAAQVDELKLPDEVMQALDQPYVGQQAGRADGARIGQKWGEMTPDAARAHLAEQFVQHYPQAIIGGVPQPPVGVGMGLPGAPGAGQLPPVAGVIDVTPPVPTAAPAAPTKALGAMIQAALGVRSPGLGQFVHVIVSPSTTVGRVADNDVVLAGDEAVSRHHARFLATASQLAVEDLGSANGTLVNGRRIAPHQPCPLRGGETIQMGNTLIQVQLLAGAASPTTVIGR